MPVPKFNKMRTLTENKEVPAAEIGSVPILMEQLKQAGEPDILSVKIVPRAKIKFHEENQYSQIDIEKLGQSILSYGLLNIPSGYYDEEMDVYVVENGERRTRALDWLIQTYAGNTDESQKEIQLYKKYVKKYEGGYPFHLSERLSADEPSTRIDELRSLLRLEDANLEARDDAEERASHIQRRMQLLKEYNELVGDEEKYNIPQQISKDFGISERQAFKYTATTALLPELQEEFLKKNISLNDAAAFSGLSEEMQRSVLELIRAGETVEPAEMKKVQEEMDRIKEESGRMLKEKEDAIKKLTEEKIKAEESIDVIIKSVQEAAEQEQAKIRKEIEEEFKNSVPDTEKLNEMEDQLREISKKHEDTIHQLTATKKNAAAKDEEIQKLKEDLDRLQKESQKENVTEKIRAEMAYQNLLSGLKDAADKYMKYVSQNGELLNGMISNSVGDDVQSIIAKLGTLK